MSDILDDEPIGIESVVALDIPVDDGQQETLHEGIKQSMIDVLRAKKGWSGLARLGPQHIQVVLMRMAGQKPKTIAAAMGVSPSFVSNTLNSTLGQELMADMLAHAARDVVDIKKRMQMMSPGALNVLQGIMEDNAAKKELRSSIAFGILDRAGYGVTTKIEASIPQRGDEIPDETSTKLMRAIAESSEVRGEVVLTPVANPVVASEQRSSPISVSVSEPPTSSLPQTEEQPLPQPRQAEVVVNAFIKKWPVRNFVGADT